VIAITHVTASEVASVGHGPAPTGYEGSCAKPLGRLDNSSFAG
jgi:hypothetical protein